MKLLLETNEILESKSEVDSDGNKHYFLEGVFLQANKKNRNGRIYPMDIMEKEVARYSKEYIDKHRAFGELGHPTGDAATSINFDNVSHIIEKVWRDGDYFKARAKILDTPKGKIVQELIKNGCQLGVSSRALGSVTHKDDADYVGEDFNIIALADIVAEPSAQAAFPQGICESTEYELDERTGEYRMVTEKKEVPLDETKVKELSEKQKASLKMILNQIVENHKSYTK